MLNDLKADSVAYEWCINFFENDGTLPASRYYMFNYSVTDDQKGPNGLNMPAYIGLDDIMVKKFTYQK